jgi:hypothetical protein
LLRHQSGRSSSTIAEEVIASPVVAEHVGYPTFGQEDDEVVMVAAVMDHGLEEEKKEQVRRE